MAITIDWGNRIIHVPKADMLLIQSTPTEIRELDINSFRLDLKDLEDSEEGMPFPDTHKHNTAVSLGGVTYARVIEIINDYTITFEDGQYAVNLVGANSNIADRVNVNQVSVRSANSAGLTYSRQMENLSYTGGMVYVDATFGIEGTRYPIGTPNTPVNNLLQAEQIVYDRQLQAHYHLHGNFNLDNTVTIIDSLIFGVSYEQTKLYLIGGIIDDCGITNAYVTGDANGGEFDLSFCIIDDMVNFLSSATQSGFSGTMTWPPGVSAYEYLFTYCYSNVAGVATPIFDFNNATNLSVQFRAYTGGMTLKNYSDPNGVMSIDLLSGSVTIDSSCTEGTIVVRGTGFVNDNSGPNCTVISKGVTATHKLLSTQKYIALK